MNIRFCLPGLKSLSAILALTLTMSAARAQAAGSQEERFQRTFAVNPGSTLVVDNHKGLIHVTGSGSNQVVVNVYKNFSGSDSTRKWWMAETQVNFHNDPNRVEIGVEYPNMSCFFFCSDNDGNYWGVVELTIQVPRQTNVELRGHKPEMTISSIQGYIRINSYKSPIEIRSTTGAIHVNTYKDSVKLTNVDIRGTLDLKTYKGDALIEAKSLGNEATLETEKGNVVLRVPQNTGLDVDFSGNRRSSFRSDFPIAAEGNFARSFRGTINQGGTRLHLRTGKGSISLEKTAL